MSHRRSAGQFRGGMSDLGKAGIGSETREPQSSQRPQRKERPDGSFDGIVGIRFPIFLGVLCALGGSVTIESSRLSDKSAIEPRVQSRVAAIAWMMLSSPSMKTRPPCGHGDGQSAASGTGAAVLGKRLVEDDPSQHQQRHRAERSQDRDIEVRFEDLIENDSGRHRDHQ